MAKLNPARMGISPGKVEDLPIFFVFQSITPYIYEHDKNAITGNPLWIALQYVGAENKHITEQNRKTATSGKEYKYDLAKGFNSLDEYPFASTYQGGVGASVEAVPGVEQRIQGNHLSSFYGSKLNYQSGWFLVVPLPF